MEDEKIIELYFERSSDAISQTERKYGRLCNSIAFNILNSHSDADECENDAYLAVWNNIPPLHPQRFMAYLGRVVRNIALERYDFNSAKKRGGQMDSILPELMDCVPAPGSVEAQCEAEALAQEISDFLRTVDVEARRVFVRRYWYSDSISDISARFERCCALCLRLRLRL